MRRKSGLLFLLFFCALAFAPFRTVCAYGITALNVAVLPPVITDKYASKADIKPVQAKITRHFRYPYYELVPAAKINDALLSLEADLKAKKPYDEEVLKKVSEKLSADIVVIMELAKVRSYTYYRGWLHDEEVYLETDVVLNCYTYSAQTGKYHKAKAAVHNIDTLSVVRGLDVVLPELAAEALEKIPYKTIPDDKL